MQKLRLNDASLAILLIVGAFMAITLINPAWIYNPIGFVDGWLYFGHFIDLPGFWRDYPQHPTGDLLPHLVPAAALYKIFSPHFANLVFKFLTYFFTSLFVFLTARREIGKRGAFFALLCFLFYKFFLIAAGTDYMDGRAVLYFAGAIYFISRALRAEKNKYLWFVLSGIFSAFYIFTSLLGIAYLPLLVVFYAANSLLDKRELRVEDFFVFVVGVCLATLFLSAIYWVYTGKIWFFKNSIEKALRFLDMVRGNPLFLLKDMHWAMLSVYMLVFFIVRVIFMRRNSLTKGEIVFNAMNAVGLFCACFLQIFKAQETVSNYSYFGFFMPVVFITLAANAEPFLFGLFSRSYNILLAVLAVISLFSFVLSSKYCEPNFIFRDWLSPFAIVAWLCLCAGVFKFDLKKSVPWMFVVVFVTINFSPKRSFMLYKELGVSPYVSSRKQGMDYALGWFQIAKIVDPDRNKYLWHNSWQGRDFFNDWCGVSHAWPESLFNASFPQVNVPIVGGGLKDSSVLRDRGVIILAPEQGQINYARTTLAKEGLSLSCGAPLLIPMRVKVFSIYNCVVRAN